MTIGFILWVIVIAILISAIGHDFYADKSNTVTGLCFALPSDLPERYTPAFWIERDGLSSMTHQQRATRRCLVKLDTGPSVTADFVEVWVDRGGL
jgi:hypothetical protein